MYFISQKIWHVDKYNTNGFSQHNKSKFSILADTYTKRSMQLIDGQWNIPSGIQLHACEAWTINASAPKQLVATVRDVVLQKDDENFMDREENKWRGNERSKGKKNFNRKNQKEAGNFFWHVMNRSELESLIPIGKSIGKSRSRRKRITCTLVEWEF